MGLIYLLNFVINIFFCRALHALKGPPGRLLTFYLYHRSFHKLILIMVLKKFFLV